MASCCNEDNNASNANLNVAEKIIGKWMMADLDGQQIMTNNKRVITFVSATQAYVSASLNSNPGMTAPWAINKQQGDEQNVITDEQIEAAKAKGWKVNIVE